MDNLHSASPNRRATCSGASSPLSELSSMADPFETTAAMGPEQDQGDQSSSELSVLSRTPSPFHPPSRMEESSESESESEVEEAFRKLAVEDTAVPFSFDDEYAKAEAMAREGKTIEAKELVEEFYFHPDLTHFNKIMCLLFLVHWTPFDEYEYRVGIIEECFVLHSEMKADGLAGEEMDEIYAILTAAAISSEQNKHVIKAGAAAKGKRQATQQASGSSSKASGSDLKAQEKRYDENMAKIKEAKQAAGGAEAFEPSIDHPGITHRIPTALPADGIDQWTNSGAKTEGKKKSKSKRKNKGKGKGKA